MFEVLEYSGFWQVMFNYNWDEGEGIGHSSSNGKMTLNLRPSSQHINSAAK